MRILFYLIKGNGYFDNGYFDNLDNGLLNKFENNLENRQKFIDMFFRL
jgi:hypothetical protein